MTTRTLCTAAIVFAATSSAALALSPQAPPGYYTTVDATTPAALRSTLHAVIDDHTRYPYTSSATDTWNILEMADQDPTGGSNILDVYRNASYAKVGGGNTNYNREHTWPKSYGFPNDGGTNYPYTDCHHLFLCNSSYNSSRSNKPYRDCGAGCSEKVTDFNAGVGGGSGTYPGNSDWTTGSGTTGTWETWADRRGDVARALMYLDVRYEGGLHGSTGAVEPDLILTDDESLIASSNTGSNQTTAYMGLKSTLLSWHLADPVSSVELARNDVIGAFQGNRNPFIDHPEWAECLFGSGCGSGGGPGGGGSTGDAWINEFHYDNASSDVAEGIEIAGPAGLDLSGWSVALYNGNGGSVYSTVSLSGEITNQSSGFGTKWFAKSGLQNGAPDGLALVDSSGSVVDFLSYEGTMTASSGPAAGMTSSDVGVSETSATPVGHSLQLDGTGSSAAEFSWAPPMGATPGQPNAGQTFTGGGGSGGGPEVWINELHYDDKGSDSQEGVEVAGTAGTSLSGWSIVAYNGSNGASYKTQSLSGTLGNQGAGIGTIWRSISGLQNGAPDGVALVDDSGNVVQFLSYEGTLTASNGPAAGMTSDSIGVNETSSTKNGHSLQLGGTGSSYADFAWQSPQSHTRGNVNQGQTFSN